VQQNDCLTQDEDLIANDTDQ